MSELASAELAELERIVRQLETAENARDGPEFGRPFAVDADFVTVGREHQVLSDSDQGARRVGDRCSA